MPGSVGWPSWETKVKPYTFIFSTMAIDGRIAGETGFSRLSCHEDFVLQHKLRARSDAVMVGAGTVVKDDPRLTVRLVPGASPARIVVDGSLRTSPKARVYSGPGLRILVTSTRWSRGELERFRDIGVEVIQVPEDELGLLDLGEALRLLRESFNIRRLMVEGGGRLNYDLLARGLIDEVRITVSPYVMGAGVSIFHRPEAWAARKGREPMARLVVSEYRVLCGHWIHIAYKVAYD